MSKENSDELKTLLKFLEDAEKIADVGSWLWYPELNSVIWSNQLYQILGFEPGKKQASAENFFSVIHPEDRPRIMESSQKFLAEKDEYSSEDYRLMRTDGSVRFVRSKGRKEIDAQGKIVRIIGTILDITSEKEHEAKKIEIEKLSSINALAAGVAHDFNNSLQIILGHHQLIMDRLPELNANHKFQDSFGAIKRAAHECVNLVQRILLLSNQYDSKPQLIDVGKTIQDMKLVIDSLVGEGCQLHREIPENLLIYIDANEFNQAILNLIQNSKKAIKPNGNIWLKAFLETNKNPNLIGEGQTGNMVHIQIIDDGHGIDNKDLGKIFDPFFTTDRMNNSSGLGLSSVYSIARRNRGSATVKSTKDKGTTIELCFPETRNLTKQVALAKVENTTRSVSILYAEDNSDLRSLVEEFLIDCGHSVTSVCDGEQAIKLLKTQNIETFDLVISDLVMPKMGGVDLALTVWQTHPSTQFIFLSGYGEVEEKEKIQHNQENYLTLAKPIQMAKLNQVVLETIQKNLQQKRPA